MRTSYTNILYGALAASAMVVVGLLTIALVPALPGIDLEARVVQSGSMEPAIWTGSIVFIGPRESYAEGDIITYRRTAEETPTTHRIVETRTENGVRYFTTKGDANVLKDTDEVHEGEILGKVWFSIPLLGYVIHVAKTPWGFIALVGIPALVVMGSELRTIIKEIARMRKKKVSPSPTQDTHE